LKGAAGLVAGTQQVAASNIAAGNPRQRGVCSALARRVLYATTAMRIGWYILVLAAAHVACPRTAWADPPADATSPSSRRVITLAEFQRSALSRQPQLRAARANTQVAFAQADEALAPMLPQVVGTASYTRETGNFVPRPGVTPAAANAAASGSLFSPSYDYWQFGLTATQLIYDFGQTSGKYGAAKQSAEAQHVAEQSTRLTILLNVRRAYFNARASKELVGVAKETLDDQNKHLAQVEGMVQVGTQPAIALAQQKASVANAVVGLISAENNYETSKAALNQAAGVAQGTDYDVADEDMGPVAGEDQSRDVLIAKAIAARPELAALDRLRESQEKALSAARGGYGPSIAASAGVSDAGLSLGQLVPNWNAGVSVTWYLFQGGLTRAQVRQAEAQVENADAQKSLEELQIRLDVDSARLAVRAAKATIKAASDALVSARQQLTLAEQRFATGVGNIIELTDAQVAYSSAAAQVVQARFGLASARAGLLAALGQP
jgi:outer membrane protein